MNRNNQQKPINILLVEDNSDDAALAVEAFKGQETPINLVVVEDGETALDYLRKHPPYTDVARPDLILLDWHLPKKDGWEVLQEIRNTPNLKQIPVIVLSASQAEEDVRMAYEHYANSYLIKPTDFEQFVKVVEVVEDFWLRVVKLPSNER